MLTSNLSSDAYALKLLEKVTDPCSVAAGSPASIVELGLIRAVRIQEVAPGCWHVWVELRLTGPGCLLGPAFCVAAQSALSAGGYAKVSVTVAGDFDWTPQDMRGALAERAAKAQLARQKATRHQRGK